MINRFIDLIFIADLVLQFFVVYEEAAHADKQITADVTFCPVSFFPHCIRVTPLLTVQSLCSSLCASL